MVRSLVVVVPSFDRSTSQWQTLLAVGRFLVSTDAVQRSDSHLRNFLPQHIGLYSFHFANSTAECCYTWSILGVRRPRQARTTVRQVDARVQT